MAQTSVAAAAIQILFETVERCSTAGLCQVDLQMPEPLAVFKWMLTSEQLEKVETAAQGNTQAKVTLAPKDVAPLDLALVANGSRRARQSLTLGRQR